MIDFFWHPNFYLVQASIFVISSLSLMNTNNSIYTNSTFYKSIFGFLGISTFIIAFLEHKWWVSIIYLFASMLIQAIPVKILQNILAPSGYTSTTKGIYVIAINLASIILLIYSVYIIIF